MNQTQENINAVHNPIINPNNNIPVVDVQSNDNINRVPSSSHGDKEAPNNAQIDQDIEIELNHNDYIISEENFFIPQPNIHLIKSGEPKELRIIDKKTTLIKSETVITTLSHGKPASSYLTNPQNINGKFYYLLYDIQTAKFNPTFAWRDNLLNMVSLGEFTSFLTELNSLKSKTQAHLQDKIISTNKIRYSLEYIGLILVLGGIALFITCPFVFDVEFVILIGLAPALLLVGIILLALGYYCYGSNYPFQLHHDINVIAEEDLHDKQAMIKKWSEQLFIRKRVLLTYPLMMSYIQINTNPEWKLVIEDHKENHNE